MTHLADQSPPGRDPWPEMLGIAFQLGAVCGIHEFCERPRSAALQLPAESLRRLAAELETIAQRNDAVAELRGGQGWLFPVLE